MKKGYSTTWEFAVSFNEGDHMDFADTLNGLERLISDNQDSVVSYVALWKDIWGGEEEGLVDRQEWIADNTAELVAQIKDNCKVPKRIRAEI